MENIIEVVEKNMKKNKNIKKIKNDHKVAEMKQEVSLSTGLKICENVILFSVFPLQ